MSSLFPKCPYCPILYGEEDIDGNRRKLTNHDATSLKPLNTYVLGEYDIPHEFELDGIWHIHDFNNTVVTWQCAAGHIFESQGKRECTGCMVAQHKANMETRDNQLRKDSTMPQFNKIDHSLD